MHEMPTTKVRAEYTRREGAFCHNSLQEQGGGGRGLQGAAPAIGGGPAVGGGPGAAKTVLRVVPAAVFAAGGGPGAVLAAEVTAAAAAKTVLRGYPLPYRLPGAARGR